VRKLELLPIAATSPTLAESMRSCSLRAALSRTSSSDDYVLGNQKGWLGSAYHHVLAKVFDADLRNETIDAAVDRLWNEAIKAQHIRNLTHPLNRRFDSPANWPGYHLTKASAEIRAKTLIGMSSKRIENRQTSQTREIQSEYREREFIACGGKLTGRPDLVRDNEVVDFKTGAIVESSEENGVETIKAIYVRQLQIYGYLIHETLGRWIQRGTLLPAVGAGVDIQLNPQDSEREALDAVRVLDAYNDKVTKNHSVSSLAVPSPENCKWCPYKMLCPPFWTGVSAAWSGTLDGAAVEGTIKEVPRLVHGGAARALSIDVHAGSEATREMSIAPINPAIHDIIDALAIGDTVRIVGLRARPDGVLVPQIRTVMMRADVLPELSAGTQSQGSHADRAASHTHRNE
jgi:PD-(D/E)XK nuclease superfamily